MLHDITAIRRTLVSAHKTISKQDFRQNVTLFVFANNRWTADWGNSDSSVLWIDEVDHAMQQLSDHGLGDMDSGELCRDLVKMQFGGNAKLTEGVYELEFSASQVANSLLKIIALTPEDISTDSRVRDALIVLSPLEQKFLTVLATAGDGVRVSNDDIAMQCWNEAIDDEKIRNVYRSIQEKLTKNRDLQVSNAWKGYRLTLKN